MKDLRERFGTAARADNIYPLLWLHGEPAAVIRREIAAIHEMGGDGFIIESRPHPDYLGAGWWRDLSLCIAEAERRGLHVWIFDEEFYPSGVAGGRVVAEHPEWALKVLVQRSYVVEGPAPDYRRELMEFTADWERIVAVSAVPVSGADPVDLRPWVVDDGRTLTWSVPPGRWRIVVVGVTPQWSGRSVGDCIDWLNPEPVKRFLQLTHEATWSRFAAQFGRVIRGFFGDETGFENFASYACRFGEETPSMPWTEHLLEQFHQRKGYDVAPHLPALWYDTGPMTGTVRVDFMDVLTHLLQTHFFGQIQSWCHGHGVRFIGHLVEDNGAHWHHGYGPGHFFRMMDRFDVGGYDLVAQVRPGQSEGIISWGPWRWDAPFFYWTVARLARSASHFQHATLQTMSETFGAYGWGLGIRTMLWLTHWQIVRGTTWFVPHAFNPRFPDPDCPPHFYAGGSNPQWPWLREWADTVHRVAHVFADGQHVGAVAVLYPAEAEWYGGNSGLEDVGAVLARAHFDYDLLSADVWADPTRCRFTAGTAAIAQETVRVIVVPALQAIPLRVWQRLRDFCRGGGHVLAVDHLPQYDTGGDHAALRTTVGEWRTAGGRVVSLAELADACAGLGVADIAIPDFPELQHYHVRQARIDRYFLNNEALTDRFHGWVWFDARGVVELWNPREGTMIEAPVYRQEANGVRVWLEVEPYEPVIVVIRPAEPEEALAHLVASEYPRVQRLDPTRLKVWMQEPGTYRGTWNTGHRVETTATEQLGDRVLPGPWWAHVVETTGAAAEPAAPEVRPLGDWAAWLPTFSGTVRYETQFSWDAWAGEVLLDLGEVWEIADVVLNGTRIGHRVTPPYRWEVTPFLLPGENRLWVAVTNTLAHRFADDAYTAGTDYHAGLFGPVRLERWQSTILTAGPEPPGIGC